MPSRQGPWGWRTARRAPGPRRPHSPAASSLECGSYKRKPRSPDTSNLTFPFLSPRPLVHRALNTALEEILE